MTVLNNQAALIGLQACLDAMDTKLDTVATAAAAALEVSDVAYNATTWDAVTTAAPSKNAMRDKIDAMDTTIAAKLTASQALNVVAIAGTLTGSADGTVEDVAAIALSTGDTYTDAAVNAAVNTAITAMNLQLKEIVTKLNEEIAALKTALLQASA